MAFAVYPNGVFVCLPRILTAASPRSYHRAVISRSDGHLVVKERGDYLALHLLWTKGCCFLALFWDFLKNPLNFLLVGKKSKWTKDFSKLSNCLHLCLHFFIGTEIVQTTKTFFSHYYYSYKKFDLYDFFSLTTLMAKKSTWVVTLFRSFYKTFRITPHFLIGTKNNKTATRSLYFFIGTQ